jgi:hypothetical protein
MTVNAKMARNALKVAGVGEEKEYSRRAAAARFSPRRCVLSFPPELLPDFKQRRNPLAIYQL